MVARDLIRTWMHDLGVDFRTAFGMLFWLVQNGDLVEHREEGRRATFSFAEEASNA